jgi:hypothetical protein
LSLGTESATLACRVEGLALLLEAAARAAGDGMSPKDIETLNQQYAGRRVLVDARRPELARLANVSGQIVAINCNGRALVEFTGADQGWHDIDPAFLKLEPSQ